MAIWNTKRKEYTDTGGAGGERVKKPTTSTPRTTNTPSTEEYYVSPEDVKREVRRQVYKDIKKGINEANVYLTDASKNIILVMELLENFSGKAADEIRNKLIQDLEEINRTGEKLNAINERATQKERELGGGSDLTNSNIYKSLESYKTTTDTGTYRCDTDVLRNEILPLLELISDNLEKAKTSTQGLPRAEGCEDIGNVSSQIDENQKANKDAKKEIEKEAEAAEKLEAKNRDISADIFNAKPDSPIMKFGAEVVSDVANTGASFLKGIFNVGESLFDAALIFCTKLADSGSMATGEYVPFEEGKGGISTEAWKDVMGFVANDHVENAYIDFYENTDAGKWLDENAHDIFKSDGAACEISSGLGEVAGIAAIVTLTGGTGAGAMAGVAGTAATGKYTEEYWGNARENAAEEEWATEETRNNGILYGAANGVWEATQWYVGGKLNDLNMAGAPDWANSFVRVGIDTSFNALDTPVRSLVDAITSDKTFEEAYEERGGKTAVITDMGVGLIGSIVGELDNLKPSRMGDIQGEGGQPREYDSKPETNIRDVQGDGEIPTKDWEDLDNRGLSADDVDAIYEMGVADRKDYGKFKMQKYFRQNSELKVDDEMLENAFERIKTFESEEEFVKGYRQKLSTYGTDCADEIIKQLGGTHWRDGEIFIREISSVVDVIHEVVHDLGNVKIRGVNSRGLNEAFTERLARKIAGVDENWHLIEGQLRGNDYEFNVQQLDYIFRGLEYLGHTGVDTKCYFKDGSPDEFANLVNKISGDENFFKELVENMDIADGHGQIKDKDAIRQARTQIMGMVNNLLDIMDPD